MRAGTQTLIQALQALPWTDSDHDDDVINHGLSPVDCESEEEEDKPDSRKPTHSI
jgi:sterol 3beta-glucosyltransferase